MQRLSSVLGGVVVAALFAGPSAPSAQASDFDKLTYVTVSGPVEIPGVALPAGTYIFKLADPDTGNSKPLGGRSRSWGARRRRGVCGGQ